jgi:HNH endonuclease
MRWREATLEDGEAAWQSGCWISLGYHNKRGVPMLRTATSNTTAAKAMWERENGPVPEGKILGSLCGTKACIRPSHRVACSRSENAYRQGITRLSSSLRLRAWVLHARGFSNRWIAEMMNVDERTIRRVLDTGLEPIREDRR